MPTELFEDDEPSWSWRGLALVVLVLILISLAFVLATAPVAALLGSSAYAIGGALHGLTATLLLFVSTIALYLAYRLFMGRTRSVGDLQIATTVMSALSFLTIVFGNWIYIAYRAKTPDSPRSYFMANAPEVHKIFFEFKEFSTLFTLPLSVAAAFILYRYGRSVLERKPLRVAVAILIALHFFYLFGGYGLGAAVTKLKSI